MTKREIDPGPGIGTERLSRRVKLSRVLFCEDEFVSVDRGNAWNFDDGDFDVPPPSQLRIMLVREINVSNNAHLNECELLQLANLQNGCHFPFLQYLRVSNSNASDLFIERLSLSAPSLTSLDASFCSKLTDSALIMLAVRSQCVTSIALSHCTNVSDVGVSFMAQKRGLNLRELDVSFCGSKITNMTANSIANNCNNIVDLKISNTSIDANGVNRIVCALSSLESLAVSGLDIGPAEFDFLCDRLARLRVLDVSFCTGLDEVRIAEQLRRIKTLTIYAFGIDFSDEVATQFGDRLLC